MLGPSSVWDAYGYSVGPYRMKAYGYDLVYYYGFYAEVYDYELTGEAHAAGAVDVRWGLGSGWVPASVGSCYSCLWGSL